MFIPDFDLHTLLKKLSFHRNYICFLFAGHFSFYRVACFVTNLLHNWRHNETIHLTWNQWKTDCKCLKHWFFWVIHSHVKQSQSMVLELACGRCNEKKNTVSCSTTLKYHMNANFVTPVTHSDVIGLITFLRLIFSITYLFFNFIFKLYVKLNIGARNAYCRV